MSPGLVRRLYWVATRDMPGDGLTEGGVDRCLLHAVSNDCNYEAKHLSLCHSKVGSATTAPGTSSDVGLEHCNLFVGGSAVGFEHRNSASSSVVGFERRSPAVVDIEGSLGE